MTLNEPGRQAAKYRAIALLLPPNLPPPRNKEYYLKRAEELEQQPSPATVATTTEPPPPATVARPSEPALTLRKQTRIHSLLAVAVLDDKRPNIARAFSVWATLRQQNRAWFDKSQVIEFYAEKTGKHPRNVRRWLAAGDGVFWTFGRKNRLSILGKDRVFANYNLIKPGVVLLVDTDKLLGKLQQVKAALYGCWTGGKNSKWASRATIRKITSVTERTQLNYDRQNKQKTQHTYAIDWRTESSDTRQLPNRYHSVFYPAHCGKQVNRKRYRLYSLEKQWGEVSPSENLGASSSHCLGTNDTRAPRRILFDNPNKAVTAACQRARKGVTGQCFMVIGDTQKGNLLLKTLDYSVLQ